MTTSRSERDDLRRLLRQRGKVGVLAIQQRGAEVIAEGEREIARIYKIDDARWSEITAPVQAAAATADQQIATICAELGIPPGFRPSLHISWRGRGENSFANRRAELRRVLHSAVERSIAAARLQLEQTITEGLELLTKGGLTDAARQMLDDLPTVQQLVPMIDVTTLKVSQSFEARGYYLGHD